MTIKSCNSNSKVMVGLHIAGKSMLTLGRLLPAALDVEEDGEQEDDGHGDHDDDDQEAGGLHGQHGPCTHDQTARYTFNLIISKGTAITDL